MLGSYSKGAIREYTMNGSGGFCFTLSSAEGNVKVSKSLPIISLFIVYKQKVECDINVKFSIYSGK